MESSIQPGRRSIYTTEQLIRYFDHISLPHQYYDMLYDETLESAIPNDNIEFLTSLQRHQLFTVPFENLSLHYSTDHTISLDPDRLYDKIVIRRRGGYCMENNLFFGTVLRSLGYKLHTAGARVSNAVAGHADGGYLGWSHMINIITFSDGNRYVSDVGFGSNGQTQPLPLIADKITAGIFPQELRLVYENIDENTNDDQRLWIYQSRNTPQDDWVPAYCFTELEFLPQDYEIMNFFTSHSRMSWFTYQIVVVKMELKGQEIVGTTMLVEKDIKRRERGKSELVQICNTEKERVQALKRWFGIELREDEIKGIKGLVTQLA